LRGGKPGAFLERRIDWISLTWRLIAVAVALPDGLGPVPIQESCLF
jgi:hypothetical protein